MNLEQNKQKEGGLVPNEHHETHARNLEMFNVNTAQHIP